MATDIEILARQITNQVLTIDAGAGRTIGDLTNNDASGSIYQSWINICTPLVPWINTHGSGSSGSGSILWGTITGSINDQTDLITKFNVKEDIINKSTDTNLGISNTLYPTQNAVKTYVDTNSGETNTASNVGAGEGGVFKQKSGVDLQFKTIKAGSNIIIINDTNEIAIFSTASGSFGSGSVIWGNISGSIQNQADLYSEITTLQNQITSISGSLDNKENIINKSTDINLGISNTLYPTQNAVKVYVDTNISASSSLTTVSNLGLGEIIYSGSVGNDLQFKTLVAGTNVTLSSNNNTITINSIASGAINPTWGQITGSIQDQTDLYSLFTTVSGSIVTEINNRTNADINLQNQITSISGSLINKEDVINKSDLTTLGTSSTLYPTQNAVKTYVDINIAASSSISTGLNLGSGEIIYTTNSGSILQFKSLVAGDNIGLVTTDQSITIHKLEEGITERSVTLSTASIFETGSIIYPKLATLSNNSFVVTYNDLVSTTGYAKIGYLQSGSVIYGDRYVFDQKSAFTNLSVIKLDDNRIITNYRSSDPYSGYLKVLTISGSVITGSGSAYPYGNSPQGYPVLKKVDTDKVVITYIGESVSPPYLGVSKIGTITGSIITYSSASVFANEYTVSMSTEVINSSLLITGYVNLDNPPYYSYIIRTGAISDTLITYGTAAVVDNNPVIEEVNISKINDIECVTLYNYKTGRQLKSKVLKIQNNNIIVGSDTIITSYGNDVGDNILDIILNSISTNIFCASYSTNPVSSSIYNVNFILGRLQNEILEYGSIYTFLSSLLSPSTYKDICSLSGNKSIIVYHDIGDTNKGKYIIGNYEIPLIEQIQNVGTGEGLIHRNTFDNIAYLKTIKAGNNVTILNNSDDITISATSTGSATTASNLGLGEIIYSGSVGNDLQFKTLVAGTNVTLSSNGNEVTINSITSGSVSGSITSILNVGTGEGEIGSISGSVIQLKTLKAGSNITIINNSEDITINSTASGSSNTLWGNISGSIQDQTDLNNILITKISNIVEDTSPQLGGYLDLNKYPLIEIFTAGENLTSGSVCQLRSDTKFWKAVASGETFTKGLLGLSLTNISANATGSFIIQGNYSTEGLTTSSTYYLSTLTSGAITSIVPSGSGNQVRIIGYALSSSSLYFKPSQFYLEIL